MKVIHRLQAYIKFKGVTYNSFTRSIGATSGYLSRMIANEASVGSDMIEKIAEVYPDLNLVWLITGNESMINEKVQDPNLQIIRDQANQIMELREEVKKLEALTAKKK